MDIFRKIICLILLIGLFTSDSPTIAKSINIPKQKEGLSQKNEFLGKWSMQTIVTDSNCPYVFVGSTTESNLEIKPVFSPAGKQSLFKALWEGGKWSKSSGKIKLLSDKEAITERVTEFIANDKNNWKAILIDHLKLNENNTIHSESIVIQYKNGLEVGQYKTFSILTKSNETE